MNTLLCIDVNDPILTLLVLIGMGMLGLLGGLWAGRPPK